LPGKIIIEEESMYEHIQVEQVGEHIAVARFNRPEARNAVNAAVAADMFDFVEKVEKDPNLRVGIVTGNGPVFCAGADLKEVSAGRDIRVKRPGGFAGFTHHKRSKPWIAALNGSAYGGGAALTLSCDLDVM